MKSDRCTMIDFCFIIFGKNYITNLFRECFNNDSGLQDLIDLFLPEIPYVAPTWECVGPGYIRSRQQ